MLLALQTTSNTRDDGTFDAVTVVLLAAFIVALVALALLLQRRDQAPADDDLPRPGSRPDAESRPIPAARPEPRPLPAPSPRPPAWLAGVALSSQAGNSLSTATAIVEQLLDARRTGALDAGITLLTPSYRARLADDLGIPERDLAATMRDAQLTGDGPLLRSVELLSASSTSLSVRAIYADRSAETYRLVLSHGSPLIDSIDPA